MAGASTTVSSIKEYSTGVKIIKLAILADAADGSVNAITVNGCDGRRVRAIVLTNGSTGLTAGSDLTMVDTISNVDYLATNGLNIGGNSSVFYMTPDTVDPITIGNLTLDVVNNLVNSATATIHLVVF